MKLFVALGILFILCTSCLKRCGNVYDDYPIIIPEELVEFGYGYDSLYLGKDSRNKIIAYYDSTVCNNCIARRLVVWHNVVDFVEEHRSSTSLLIIFSPSHNDLGDVLDIVSSNPLDYPLYIDTCKSMERYNPDISGLHSFVVLLDSANKIKVFGNPLLDNFVWPEYEQYIINSEE